MIAIKIQPLIGIDIQHVGLVKLGQPKAQVEALLGPPSSTHNDKQLYYDEYECRIDLDQQQRVEFIEFIYGPFPEKTKLSLYGIDPFESPANEVVKVLSLHNNGPIDTSEADYSYGFLSSSVGIWRELTEQDVRESMQKLQADGDYEGNKEWLAEDLKKSRHFWSVGIGVPNYYTVDPSAIR